VKAQQSIGVDGHSAVIARPQAPASDPKVPHESGAHPGRRRSLAGKAKLKELTQVLETAAQKYNASADATCSVAECFERPDSELSDEMFDRIFEAVSELARTSLDRKPDYRRAARALLSR